MTEERKEEETKDEVTIKTTNETKEQGKKKPKPKPQENNVRLTKRELREQEELRALQEGISKFMDDSDGEQKSTKKKGKKGKKR